MTIMAESNCIEDLFEAIQEMKEAADKAHAISQKLHAGENVITKDLLDSLHTEDRRTLWDYLMATINVSVRRDDSGQPMYVSICGTRAWRGDMMHFFNLGDPDEDGDQDAITRIDEHGNPGATIETVWARRGGDADD